MTEAQTIAPPGVNHNADPESLRLYTKRKLALAAQLRALRDVVQRRGDKTRLEQCDDLIVKLAEDRFTLAVVGQFKRSKSSLMNAIIGRELLPVGVLPLTSAITILRYGPKERLLIRRDNVALPFPEEFPVQRLAEFVTGKENPGNCKRIKTATIEVPLPFLRRGLEFVDTPGIGSAIAANTATTLNFLPECDAVLFVTSVDSPFTRVELEFLKNIRQHVRKIFFIVNKTDLLDANERSDVLDYVRTAIREQMGTEDVNVFPVSARLGLAAKLNGGWSECLESGLTELEDSLAHFLSGEKASVFLVAVINRALWLCGQESVEIGLRERANELPEKVLIERLGTVTAQWEDRKEERRQIFERLRQRILSEVHVALMPELLPFIRSETDAFAAAVERLSVQAAWWPLWDRWEQIEQTALNQTNKNVLDWLSERAARFSFAADEAARADWQRIQANLAGLPAIAADVFGLCRVAKADKAMLPPWRLNAKFEPPLVFNFRRRVHLPMWPAILPAFLTRKWLKKHLRKESERMAGGWQDAVITYAADNVRKALDHLANDVEMRAHEIGLRVMASLRSGESFPRNLTDGTETLDAVRRQLLALRNEISPVASPTQAVGESVEMPTLPTPSSSISLPAVEPPKPDPVYDLKTRSCPACNYLAAVLFHFLSQFQYDLAYDDAAQEDFAETLGFCALHTWQLEAVSSPVGASIGFAKLVERVSKILAARAKSPANGHNAVKLVRGSSECHVCRLLREAERDYLRRLAEFIERPEGCAAYAGSQGVCLRHLGLWLPMLADEEIARFVLEEAARHFEQMAEDMQHFSLKTQALRRNLRNQDEADAYLRAITHLAGTKGNCVPMSREVEI